MFKRPRLMTTIVGRAYSQAKAGGSRPKASGSTVTTGGSTPPVNNVTGLTSNCVKANTGPVGPGAAANAEYKVPEYFSFNRFSYHEAEVEMAKYRCPQPSALPK